MVESYSPCGANVHPTHRKPNIGSHGNVSQNLDLGYVFIGFLDPENPPPIESNIVPLAITQQKL